MHDLIFCYYLLNNFNKCNTQLADDLINIEYSR